MSIQFSKVIASRSDGKGEAFSAQRVDLSELGELASRIICSTSSAVAYVLRDSEGGLRSRDSLGGGCHDPGGIPAAVRIATSGKRQRAIGTVPTLTGSGQAFSARPELTKKLSVSFCASGCVFLRLRSVSFPAWRSSWQTGGAERPDCVFVGSSGKLANSWQMAF
jgi:hypothetical protein